MRKPDTAARIMLLFVTLLLLTACTGPGNIETEQGICTATGQGWSTSYNRHGPITRCVLPE